MDGSVYDSIDLSDDEKEAAMLEARKKKYFHERNKAYWEAQELQVNTLQRVKQPQEVKKPESKPDTQNPK